MQVHGISDDWVAVKELKLSYHDGSIQKIIWFPQFSNFKQALVFRF